MAAYNMNELRQRIPNDRDEFFIGFRPWPEDCLDWDRSVDEGFQDLPLGRLRRTIWDNPEERQSRMLIDVVELPSTELAVETLAEALNANQLAMLPEGPSGLGFVSFVHPEGAPPAAFFVQGNLFLSVSSIGATPLDVAEWSSRQVRRLLDRPDGARDAISVEGETSKLRRGEPAVLTYALPSDLGEFGFIKIISQGARLSRDDSGEILATPTTGEISVELLAVERGREPMRGRLRVNPE